MNTYMLIYTIDHNSHDAPKTITAWIEGLTLKHAVSRAKTGRYLKYNGFNNYYRLTEVKIDE